MAQIMKLIVPLFIAAVFLGGTTVDGKGDDKAVKRQPGGNGNPMCPDGSRYIIALKHLHLDHEHDYNHDHDLNHEHDHNLYLEHWAKGKIIKNCWDNKNFHVYQQKIDKAIFLHKVINI